MTDREVLLALVEQEIQFVWDTGGVAQISGEVLTDRILGAGFRLTPLGGKSAGMSDVITRIREEQRSGDGMVLTVDEVDELAIWINDHWTEADNSAPASPDLGSGSVT